ncbi:MAG: lipid II flippase MurJ [Candidatus Paceibacterota bacterium]
MVKRLLKLFHYEFSGLHNAALVLALSSSVSAVLGLFRDRLLAGTFGAGESLDVYYAAFKIPDLIYNIISLSLVSITALIPFFLEKTSASPCEGKKYLSDIFSVFFGAMAALSAIAFFAVPFLIDVVAPGFSPEAKHQLIILSRILLITPFIQGLSNLLATIVQSFNRFFIYALSLIVYNVGIIFGIVFLSGSMGTKGIVWGVIIGALLQVFIMIPSCLKLGFLPRLRFKIKFSDILKTMKLSFPRTIGLGLNQILMIFITAFASFLSVGSVAIFNLSFNLQYVPLTVVGLSYSTAAFPTLARLFVNNQKEKFLEYTAIAMRQILFWSIPATVLFIVLRAQIIRVIYGYGLFDWRDTRLTAAALGLFSVSVAGQAIILLLTRAFFAAGKTKKPIIVNAISSVFIIAGIFVLMQAINLSAAGKFLFGKILRVEDIKDMEVLILPFVFSIGMILNSIFLVKSFQKEFGGIWSSVKSTFFQVIVASLLMGAVTYSSLSVLDRIFNIKTFVGIFFQGFVSAVFGMGFWYVALSAAKNRELREITESLKQKFWKSPVIASEREEL